MEETQVWSLGWEDPWRRKWQPTPVFLLGNPMDRGARQSIAHGAAKSQTRLSDKQFHFLYILSTFSWSLLILLGLYYFCPLLCSSLHEMFLWYPQFSWRDLWSFPFCCFPLFLCIVHWRRLSCLSLLFSWTLYSVGYTFFPFSIAFCFSSFLGYLQSLLTQSLCLFASPFLWDGFDHCFLYSITNLCPQLFRQSVYQI